MSCMNGSRADRVDGNPGSSEDGAGVGVEEPVRVSSGTSDSERERSSAYLAQ